MKKMRMKLTFKVLMCVMLPIFLLVFFSIFAIRNVGTLMADSLQEDHLATANYAMQEILTLMYEGDFILEGDNLYKGEVNLTTDSSSLDALKESTNIDITIFCGNTRRATSILGEDGKRILGTQMSDEVYQTVLDTHYYFSDSVLVEGVPYYGAYQYMTDVGTGKEIIVFAGISVSESRKIYQKNLNQSILFMIVIALLSAAVVAFVVRFIVKSLHASVANLREVADGKLNFVVSERLTSRGDEVGNIARAIDSLMQKFIGIVHSLNGSSATLSDFSGTIQENFATINTSIANVNVAVEEIATGATNQANETSAVTEQMNEMGIAVERVSDNVEVLKQSTKGMGNSNRTVSETLEELVSISTGARESIGAVQEQTNDTNQSAMEIQNVVELISDIAAQTNLLSLNASIEAARAGEQGKGFAVVADEVRKLAEQSKRSAEQIAVIVQQLIEKSNHNVEAMSNVIQEIQNQYEKLHQTRDVFEQLNSEILQVSDAVDNIAEEINNINNSKNVVFGNLESLAAISEENAASTEETSATMMHLSELMNECDNVVGKLGEISESLEGNVKQFTL